MTGKLIKRRNFDIETETHRGRMTLRDTGRMPCRDGGRDWNYAALNQGITGANGSWKSQGRILPLQVSERAWSCQYLDFGLRASSRRQKISVFLSHPISSTLLWLPKEINTNMKNFMLPELKMKQIIRIVLFRKLNL